jgi:tetratricopeptide (TPR) repeat protein
VPVALALVVLAYALAPFVPGMWLWGVDALRFLPPVAWVLVVLCALALVPPVADRILPALRALGDLVARRPAAATGAFGLAAAALVLALPDRAHFVGDFLLRQGTVEVDVRPGLLFPQALPLDVLLHYRLPVALAESHLLGAASSARALGAIEAFLAAAFAVVLARALGLAGAPAAALVLGATFTGALGLMTGYSKAFSELSVLTLAVAAFGTRVAREGRGVLPLALALALGLALHRSALAFLPAATLALILAARDAEARPRLARPAALAGYGLLALALVVFLPQIVRTATGFDVTQHFASEDVVRQGGLLRAAFAPLRLVDLANALLFLTPLAPLTLVLAGRARSRATAVLVVLAASWLLVALALFPAQGVFRDWDVFAPAGVALAALGAALAARALGGPKERPRAAVAVAAAAVFLTTLGLAQAHDRERSWARIEALVAGPPARTPVERSKTWDFLGQSWVQAGRPADAARAFGRAAETSRSPRLFLQRAIAARAAGDLVQARRVLLELVAFAPNTTLAWRELGSASWQLGDFATAARAGRELVRLSPGDRDVQASAAIVERAYREWQDSLATRQARP